MAWRAACPSLSSDWHGQEPTLAGVSDATKVQPKIAAMCRLAAGRCATVGFSFAFSISISQYSHLQLQQSATIIPIRSFKGSQICRDLIPRVIKSLALIRGHFMRLLSLSDRDFKRPFDGLLSAGCHDGRLGSSEEKVSLLETSADICFRGSFTLLFSAKSPYFFHV